MNINREIGLDPVEGVNLKVMEVSVNVLTFDLSVDPPCRNQGLARAAMEDFVQIADEMGYHIALLAEPKAEDMTQRDLMRFYRSLGFAPIGFHGYMYRPVEQH